MKAVSNCNEVLQGFVNKWSANTAKGMWFSVNVLVFKVEKKQTQLDCFQLPVAVGQTPTLSGEKTQTKLLKTLSPCFLGCVPTHRMPSFEA